MAILMGTYYGFFVPQISNSFLHYNPTIHSYVSAILFLVFFLNPIINPIVYGWMSPDFNLAYRTIMGIKSSSRSHRNISSISKTTSSLSSRNWHNKVHFLTGIPCLVIIAKTVIFLNETNCSIDCTLTSIKKE